MDKRVVVYCTGMFAREISAGWFVKAIKMSVTAYTAVSQISRKIPEVQGELWTEKNAFDAERIKRRHHHVAAVIGKDWFESTPANVTNCGNPDVTVAYSRLEENEDK